jgi:hypothetical protein
LLADRASAAALAQPSLSPGQWVYRELEFFTALGPKGRHTFIQASWQTAGDIDEYGVSNDGVGTASPSYSHLGSLPSNLAALDSYLENTLNADAPSFMKAESAFIGIGGMLRGGTYCRRRSRRSCTRR